MTPPIPTPELHTGRAVWTNVDGTKVLRIPGSPFAAMPDTREKHSWNIFLVEGRRMVGWTRGDRHDVASRLLAYERDYLPLPGKTSS